MDWTDYNFMQADALPAEQAFEKLFTDWYAGLYTYALSILQDGPAAAEAVQAVFCRLWEKKAGIQIQVSLRAYLYGAVYHQCMNGLRHNKRKNNYERNAAMHNNNNHAAETAAAKAEFNELEKKLNQSIGELPEQCRAVFQLSRFGDLKYREIAAQLNISVKTVEAQMTKALKYLRTRLADFYSTNHIKQNHG